MRTSSTAGRRLSTLNGNCVGSTETSNTTWKRTSGKPDRSRRSETQSLSVAGSGTCEPARIGKAPWKNSFTEALSVTTFSTEYSGESHLMSLYLGSGGEPLPHSPGSKGGKPVLSTKCPGTPGTGLPVTIWPSLPAGGTPMSSLYVPLKPAEKRG